MEILETEIAFCLKKKKKNRLQNLKPTDTIVTSTPLDYD